ncbi:hypothetical protein [uncultured Campylobacter sp.]
MSSKVQIWRPQGRFQICRPANRKFNRRAERSNLAEQQLKFDAQSKQAPA